MVEGSTQRRPLTSSIDGEKNGPGNDRANQTDAKENLEHAQEKIVVKRRVHQNMIIAETTETRYPTKFRILWLWRTLAGENVSDVNKALHRTKTYYFDKSGK